MASGSPVWPSLSCDPSPSSRPAQPWPATSHKASIYMYTFISTIQDVILFTYGMICCCYDKGGGGVLHRACGGPAALCHAGCVRGPGPEGAASPRGAAPPARGARRSASARAAEQARAHAQLRAASPPRPCPPRSGLPPWPPPPSPE